MRTLIYLLGPVTKEGSGDVVGVGDLPAQQTLSSNNNGDLSTSSGGDVDRSSSGDVVGVGDLPAQETREVET